MDTLRLSYRINSKNIRPTEEDEITKILTDEEHQLFASGAGVVLIEDKRGMLSRELNGYWEKVRDNGVLIENIPYRCFEYKKNESKSELLRIPPEYR